MQSTVLARSPRRRALAPALRALWAQVAAFGVPLALSALVLALYLPSLHYGLLWDDPLWYAQGRDRSFIEILGSLPTYQFYRPLAIYVNQLLCTAEGLVRAELAHAVQVLAHLGATLLLVPVLCGLGLGRRHAGLAALLFAVHPFAHQAVAWQAPQQPIATTCVLLSVLCAQQYVASRRVGLLALSALTYAAGLLYQESAVSAAWLFAWLAWRETRERGLTWRRALPAHSWLLVHLTLVVAYVVVWLRVPRSAGITGWALQSDVLAYLLQGPVYPVAWALARVPLAWPPIALLAILMAACGALLVVLARAHSRSVALLSGAWIATSLMPSWVGLRWEYVQIASRLVYPALPGASVLWAGLVSWGLSGRFGARTVGLGLLALLLSIAVGQDLTLNRLAHTGTGHLAQAIAGMSAHSGSRQLYVNFPDRLELRHRPYPLGFWGLTLAPVVQDLADYAGVITGVPVSTESLAAPELGWAAREVSPYRADLRGVRAGYEALAQAAVRADAVYVTDYGSDGSLALRDVGALPADNGAPARLVFGRGLELLSSELTPCPDGGCVQLELVWRARRPLSWGDTLFVHLLTPDGVWISGADGDALAGLMPLAAWPEGRLLRERRLLATAGLAHGDYAVTVGLYNRDTQQRYGARLADGDAVANGEPQVATLHLP